MVLKNGARYIVRIAGKSTLKNRQIEMKVLDVLTKVNFFKITYLNKNNGDYIYPYIEGCNISFKDVKCGNVIGPQTAGKYQKAGTYPKAGADGALIS